MLMDVLENMEKIRIKLPSCGFSFEVSIFSRTFRKSQKFLATSQARQPNDLNF